MNTERRKRDRLRPCSDFLPTLIPIIVETLSHYSYFVLKVKYEIKLVVQIKFLML